MLLVDDHDLFRAGLRTALGAEGIDVVGESSSGSEALTAVGAFAPEVVVMDLNMPGIGGVEATRRIVTADPDVVVILCSTREVTDVPATVADSGARAFLSKETFGVDALRRIWSSLASGPVR